MNLGLVFQQGDGVLIFVFLLLVGMSVATWSIIIWRAYRLIKAKKANRIEAEKFWEASSIEEAQRAANPQYSPLAQMITESIDCKNTFQERVSKGGLSAQISFDAYMVRHIRNAMTKALRPFESGLTTLASVGATAPFIGLFGTVWGIYHALINISNSGQMSIAAVAGPIGEALVATAAGLFVAIPAVLAYNALVRGNKTLSNELDSFAHDLHAQLADKNH